MRRQRLGLFSLAVLATMAIGIAGGHAVAQDKAPPPAIDPAVSKAYDLFVQDENKRKAALAYFREEGTREAIPVLVQAMRFSQTNAEELADILKKLAGEEPGTSWHDWMLWQEAHPEIKPPEGFVLFKAAVYSKIDINLLRFLYPGVAHEIRIEEVVWGGVRKDGIPALTNPELVMPDKADYITPDELVFGVEINGDARAYPLRILDWHEMLNDVIGGVPVSLAYCTLCGSGILFDTTVEGREKPLVFGSSGFLYRSNKLMYDTETHSLWTQFTGRPVVGELTGSGIELNTRPVVITSWADWLRDHPNTKVLSLETGHFRDYTPGQPYGQYFASDELMFPALVDESKRKAKDYVFALRGSAHQKAWPIEYFEGSPVINDSAGVVPVTLIGNAATRSVRAYRTNGEIFRAGESSDTVLAGDVPWSVTENALIGPDGQKLTRLPGHIAYWFAWNGYLGGVGEVAEPPKPGG